MLSVFVQTLLEGLSDCQAHSASGACVVLNSIVRIRGQELRKDVSLHTEMADRIFLTESTPKTSVLFSQVVELVKDIHTRLEGITHAQTRTGTLRVFRTLASHHLVPVITAILEFPPPLDQ